MASEMTQDYHEQHTRLLRQLRQAEVQDFLAFCLAHPDLRLWQALLAWSDAQDILYIKPGTSRDAVEAFKQTPGVADPFSWEQTPRRQRAKPEEGEQSDGK